MKNGAALISLGEKSCEIKGGGQELAAMMLMLKILIMHTFLCGYIYHFHTSLQREEKVYKWYNSTAISAQECINEKWR